MRHLRNCTACGRPVMFLRDEKGTVQVLDTVAPVYQVLIAAGEGDAPGVTRLRSAYVSHFATCTSPSQFSRKHKGA